MTVHIPTLAYLAHLIMPLLPAMQGMPAVVIPGREQQPQLWHHIEQTPFNILFLEPEDISGSNYYMHNNLWVGLSLSLIHI